MKWTAKQIDQLRELYKKHSYTICAKLMGVTPDQAKGAIVRYQMSSGGRTGRFEKGLKPWNAGKKGLRTAPEYTLFKKGNIPPSAKTDGAISVRMYKNKVPYQFIRIGLNKWEPLHRFNYEMFVGPILPGNIVVFKNGNTMDARPENLEQITRAEHAARNVNRAKGAESLRKLYRRERIRKQYGLPPLSKHAMRITNW